MPDSILATDPAQLGIAEAAALIARRAHSPVELTAAVLDRIAARDGALHAHITVLGDTAMAAARAAEAEIAVRGPRGPLHGIPYGLKDNYDTAGIRTTAASRARWDNLPTTDATLHARLQAAGAILIGKHNTWEYGTGMGDLQDDLPVPPPTTPGTRTITRRGPRTAPASPWRPGSVPSGSGRIPAARSGCRPRRMG